MSPGAEANAKPDPAADYEPELDVAPIIRPGENYTGFSRPAKHRYGICYFGPFETQYDGVNMAVRAHVGSIADLIGKRVWLRSFSHTHSNSGQVEPVLYDRLPVQIHEEVGAITESSHEVTLAHVYHVVPTETVVRNLIYGQMAFTGKEMRESIAKMSVLYCAFEWTKVPSDLAWLLRKFGQVWAPSDFARDVLIASGLDPERVRKVPHPLMLTDSLIAKGEPIAHDEFRFLHVSKWESRKAQYEAMHAFALAFNDRMPSPPVFHMFTRPFSVFKDYPNSPDDAFDLIWKDDRVRSNWSSIEHLKRYLRVYWDIRSKHATHKGPKPMAGVPAQLHAKMFLESDCYVSSARMEGFDLSTSQACLAGLKLVIAGIGAQTEFGHPWDEQVQTPKRELVPEFYKYPAECEWSGFSVDDLAKAMRSAFDAGRLTPSQREQTRKDMIARRDRKALGSLMIRHLADLAKANGLDQEWEQMFK